MTSQLNTACLSTFNFSFDANPTTVTKSSTLQNSHLAFASSPKTLLMSTAYKLASGNVVQHASQPFPSGFLLHPQSFGDGLSGFEINASLRLTPAMIFNMLHAFMQPCWKNYINFCSTLLCKKLVFLASLTLHWILVWSYSPIILIVSGLGHAVKVQNAQWHLPSAFQVFHAVFLFLPANFDTSSECMKHW